MSGLTDAFARRALADTMSKRHDAYVHDAQRIVASTFRLIERTGGIDPSLRDILAEAHLSTQAFYRLFRSKDELMLALLDDGRRQLVGYLEHRMEGAPDPASKVRAFIEGVMAQAQTPGAAARTRPFVVHQDRLAEAFPDEQQASVTLLVDLLRDATGDAAGCEAVYRLTFATLHDHLLRRTRPSAAEVEHLVGFALAGLGLAAAGGAPRTRGAGGAGRSGAGRG
ncbi:MAG TPA: TetR/AcrR family transcriptional regulator [Acidimicrobiales bacterium]|nr:TetR/AcrR family transcriptional regulator [Acidimicrobiales bacterium]